MRTFDCVHLCISSLKDSWLNLLTRRIVHGLLVRRRKHCPIIIILRARRCIHDLNCRPVRIRIDLMPAPRAGSRASADESSVASVLAPFELTMTVSVDAPQTPSPRTWGIGRAGIGGSPPKRASAVLDVGRSTPLAPPSGIPPVAALTAPFFRNPAGVWGPGHVM